MIRKQIDTYYMSTASFICIHLSIVCMLRLGQGRCGALARFQIGSDLFVLDHHLEFNHALLLAFSPLRRRRINISIANDTFPRPPRQRWATQPAPFVLRPAHAPVDCVPRGNLDTIQPPTSIHPQVVTCVCIAHRSFSAFEMSEALRDGRELWLSTGFTGSLGECFRCFSSSYLFNSPALVLFCLLVASHGLLGAGGAVSWTGFEP